MIHAEKKGPDGTITTLPSGLVRGPDGKLRRQAAASPPKAPAVTRQEPPARSPEPKLEGTPEPKPESKKQGGGAIALLLLVLLLGWGFGRSRESQSFSSVSPSW